MLIIKSLQCTLKETSKQLFHITDCSFKSGIVSIIQGANGTGKSTLLNILAGSHSPNLVVEGLLEINETTIKIHKQDNKRSQIEKSIGLVHQDFRTMVVNQLTPCENMQAARMSRHPFFQNHARPISENNSWFKALLEKQIPTEQLSGGQKQTLAIHMLLQQGKKIVLLDEPTAALDQKASEALREFLIDLARSLNITIILVSHDPLFTNHMHEAFEHFALANLTLKKQ